MKKAIFVVLCLIFVSVELSAHEPIYGRGPHVLFKGGFSLGFVFSGQSGAFGTEYAIEYGLTPNLTVGLSLPFTNGSADGYLVGGKYRFYTVFQRGGMREFAIFGGYKIKGRKKGINSLVLGFTAGREAVNWYWFASAGFTSKFTGAALAPGNEINYDFTLGYRVTKLDYYKPDLVVFLEFLGKRLFKSKFNGNLISQSGGDIWSVAPTLMLTYRNYALRMGVEIGLARSGFVSKTETNFRVGIETHL